MAGSVQCILNSSLFWLPTDDNLQAHSSTIYLFRCETAELLPLYSQCYAVLDAKEQERAMSYSQPTDRQRSVIQHGLLRGLLGWYLGVPISESFQFGEYGKPYLGGDDANHCCFNLSSSSGVFLIAIGDREMGIDIEKFESGVNYSNIAAQYFSKTELDYLSASAKPEQAFYLLWTRKEALMKAVGEGINDDLPHIPALNGVHTLPGNTINWITQSYVAAADNEVISITYPQPETVILTRQIEGAWAGALFN